MEKELAELRLLLAEITDLYNTASLLGWDQQTLMPAGAAEERGFQIGTVRKNAHTLLTSPQIGNLLDKLQPLAESLDPDSDDARLIKKTRRDFEKAARVPPEMVAELAQLTSVAHQAWVIARQKNEFDRFRPFLESVIDQRRRYAELFAPYEHVYDPLLDIYEPELKTREVRQIFGELRQPQTNLVREITARPQVESSFLTRRYDEQKQWDFGVSIISQIGYDWNRGRQDKSAHPFTENMGINDVRITTRINPDYLSTALFGTLHEAGHALYEMGVDPALKRSPLAGGNSLGVHEFQSRLWENLVGRSFPFWEYFYPHLQQVFPAQLQEVALNQFYRGINRVQPSFIRVEADEASYNLHIMLRLEIEIAMMEGSLEVKDLPEKWNARMQDYLGIVPSSDTVGVLQDVHWSSGLIGYFSTYALGNLISVQLWECIQRDIPDLSSQIRSGEFSSLLSWLREKIHRHGAKFEPQELVERATGSRISPAPYIRYLRAKYGDLYGL